MTTRLWGYAKNCRRLAELADRENARNAPVEALLETS
jgi:hypothetical protein